MLVVFESIYAMKCFVYSRIRRFFSEITLRRELCASRIVGYVTVCQFCNM